MSWLSGMLRLAPVFVQLGLAGLVIWQFHLESRSFFKVFALAVVAFPVHALMPLRYRMPFFTAVSLAAILVVFGVHDGGLLIAASLLLIAACHLPGPFLLRVCAVTMIGGVFALARAGVLDLPVSAAVWPILASMFMFRLALYLHTLRHDPTPQPIARTLAYFFMLPNVCYPLFPVVDYANFGRSHYEGPALAIYERGVRWIIRGLIHLLIYRFVYLHITMDPAEVADLGDLVQFMVSTFLLYLRVSGQFHLIVGMLHLFGFRLPETHRLYYLASSFTDLWRRINIYWKDFMMKLVFYPSFFRLRHRGDTFALVGATLVVFMATWLLHSYQWFWLRGSFPLTLQDAIFWVVLGGLVIENSLRERRRGRQRSLRAADRAWSWRRALRVFSVFATLCVLWSMWSSDSVLDWLTLWSAAVNVGLSDLLLLGVLVGGFLMVAGRPWDSPVAEPRKGDAPDLRAAATGFAVLVALLVVGRPEVRVHGGERFAALVGSLRVPALNQRDAQLQHRGYYEGLDNRGRLSAELWQVYTAIPADWAAIQDTEVYERRDDFELVGLHPDMRDVPVKGAPFSTNRWGMRDRDYTQAKPPGTVRIAVLGPSHTAGSGVRDDEVFDEVLETELNRSATAGVRYEVLNFSVPRHTFVQQLVHLENRVRDFEPDVVMVTATGRGYHDEPLARYLMAILRRRIDIPYPELEQIIAGAGIHGADLTPDGRALPFEFVRRGARRLGMNARLPERELRLRLESVTDEITDWTVQRMHKTILGMGAVPVLLALDLVGTEDEEAPALEMAKRRGFVIIDLLDVYSGHDPAELWLGEWDNHPNARAHELIAHRLRGEIERQAVALRLPFAANAQ